MWFDHLDEILKKVNRSSSTRWDRSRIEALFDVHRETARKIMMAIESPPESGNAMYVQAANLRTFLLEFKAIIPRPTADRKQRAMAIKSAQALLRQKFAAREQRSRPTTELAIQTPAAADESPAFDLPRFGQQAQDENGDSQATPSMPTCFELDEPHAAQVQESLELDCTEQLSLPGLSFEKRGTTRS